MTEPSTPRTSSAQTSRSRPPRPSRPRRRRPSRRPKPRLSRARPRPSRARARAAGRGGAGARGRRARGRGARRCGGARGARQEPAAEEPATEPAEEPAAEPEAERARRRARGRGARRRARGRGARRRAAGRGRAGRRCRARRGSRARGGRVAPRERPEIPGADLIPDIVPEGEEFLDAEAAPRPRPRPRRPRRARKTDGVDEAQPIADAAIDLAAGARYTATGKRKTAVARVILKPGTGTYAINGKELENFFPRETLQRIIRQPLEAVGYESRMDVVARMHGGGVSAQAGALRHGISRALLVADPNLRGELKRRGFLTRDPRVKERKKAGPEEGPQAAAVLEALTPRSPDGAPAIRHGRCPRPGGTFPDRRACARARSRRGGARGYGAPPGADRPRHARVGRDARVGDRRRRHGRRRRRAARRRAADAGRAAAGAPPRAAARPR